MDFGMPNYTNDLDKELIERQKAESAEKEREMAKEAKKKLKVNNKDDGSAGLCDIINEMEKKLDSAQRRFQPKFGNGASKEASVNQFDIDFEKEAAREYTAMKRS